MLRKDIALTQERLKEVLDYDPENGFFVWKKITSNRVAIGRRAGQPDTHGHIRISIDGVRFSAHQLAWLYVHGRWPKDEIDHINLIKDDNRIQNLREANRSENNRNVGMKKSNKVGVKGVMKQDGRYFRAQISVNGRTKYLGIFKTPELAHLAYQDASRKFHGNFGRFS